jgi:hypothetical protein
LALPEIADEAGIVINGELVEARLGAGAVELSDLEAFREDEVEGGGETFAIEGTGQEREIGLGFHSFLRR